MTPRLGFGTAPILGSRGRRDSVRALRGAINDGIRHFDTARSYGWGEAEALVGQAIQAVPRADVILVGKCGLVPRRSSVLLRVGKSVARRAVSLFPVLRPHARRVATSALQPSETYELSALQASLAQSLRALQTPYLDVMLLHNFEPGKPGLEPVVSWMRGLKAAGTVRDYGFCVEANLLEGLGWLREHALLEDAVIQAPVSDQLLALPDIYSRNDFIVHSPFRYLEERSSAGATMDLTDLLRRVVVAVRCRAVVCSMFSDAHRRQNIAAADIAFAS